MFRFLRRFPARTLPVARPTGSKAAGSRPQPASGACTVEFLERRTLFHGPGDVVLDWNEVLLDAVREDTTQAGPVRAARNMAIMHVSMYDAINGVTHEYEPFWVFRPAPLGADPEAAAAAAAFQSLCKLFPQQKYFLREEYYQSLAEIPDGTGERLGVRYGKQVANRVLRWRRYDGSFDEAFYEPGNRPGDWRPTPPDFRRALHPGAGEMETFAIPGVREFLPPPPPALDTEEYTDAYYEVWDLGGRHSTTRTAEQTEIGTFWAYDRAELGTPLVLYNQVLQTIATQEGNTVEENARLFALANVAMADAGITAWECKYLDSFWRPVTGIHEGDFDGNLDTIGDPDWEPLGAPGGPYQDDFTPPFPAYVSGHSTFGAAVFRTLENFYGTDAVPFALTSDELPGVVRYYDSFSEAARENGDSRIYLGIHWRFDDTYGQEVGRQVADYVFEHYFGAGA